MSILPIVSTKRSDNGAPEATVIVLGLESGSVLFYLSNGTLLIEQLLHKENGVLKNNFYSRMRTRVVVENLTKVYCIIVMHH